MQRLRALHPILFHPTRIGPAKRSTSIIANVTARRIRKPSGRWSSRSAARTVGIHSLWRGPFGGVDGPRGRWCRTAPGAGGIHAGSTRAKLDFWRVEEIDRGKLLRLRAEMKVPGGAWLELRVSEGPAGADGRPVVPTSINARSSSLAGSRVGRTGIRSCLSTESSSRDDHQHHRCRRA